LFKTSPKKSNSYLIKYTRNYLILGEPIRMKNHPFFTRRPASGVIEKRRLIRDDEGGSLLPVMK